MIKNDLCSMSKDGGFTLPEIITAIVLIGILGAVAVQFMASALEDSTLPIDRVQADANRVSIMEKIISDYVSEVNKSTPADALATINTKVVNGYYNSGNATVLAAWIEFVSPGPGLEIESEVTPGPSDYLRVSVKTGNAGYVAFLSKSRADATDPKVAF